MFVGSVPLKMIEQVTWNISFAEWGDISVGCSGAFRFDGAVKGRFPECRVHGNDVSLLSCALGALLTDAEVEMRFHGEQALVEGLRRSGSGEWPGVLASGRVDAGCSADGHVEG